MKAELRGKRSWQWHEQERASSTAASRCPFERQPVPYRKAQCVLLHGLSRLIARICGGGDDANAFVLELGSGLFASSQLLLAVGSPVRTVEQQHAPSVSEGVG